MREQQHRRQHQRAERVDVLEWIEADTAQLPGRLVAELVGHETVGRLVECDGDYERQDPDRYVIGGDVQVMS
jgi:hypothetical protein